MKFTIIGLLWFTLVAAVVAAGIARKELQAGIMWLTVIMLIVLVAVSREGKKRG
jgi:hypothetical protein